MLPSRSAIPLSFLAVAISLPLLVSRHTLPLATFYGEWTSALLFALSVIVLGALAQRQGRGTAYQAAPAQFPWIVLFPLWLIATGITQTLTGMADVSGSRLLTELSLALGAAVMWAAWRQGRAASSVERQAMVDVLAIAWLVAGLLGTLAQWVQVFGLEPDTLGMVSTYFYDDNRRLWGNLNQPNHQATVAGIALAAAVWLAARGWLRVPAWLGAALLLVSGIVLSGSRTGVLHVGLAAVYALVAAWMARGGAAFGGPGDLGGFAGSMQRAGHAGRNPMRRPAGLAFAAVAMVVLLLVLQPAIKSAGQAMDWHLFDTVAQLQGGDQLSWRAAMWAHAWAMFRAHPWLGVGWGEYGWAQFQQLAQVGVKVEMSLHAHNAVLDMLAKMGVIGAAGVFLSLLAWLWRVARQRLWRGDARERAQTGLVLTWLAMLCAHSMLEYPLHYLYFVLPFCFMLGWLEPSGFGRLRVPRGFAVLAGLAFAGVAAAILTTMWQDYRRAEAREYARAERRAALPMPNFWFRQAAASDAIEEARITPENAAQLLGAHIAAVHLLPTPTLISRTAWLMALTGDPVQARAWLERLRFYFAGDEANQFAELARACAEVDAAARPRDFCDWVQLRAKHKPE
ncbi:PglL family O-oligosaccharyltransferase [Cupriavidus basilensis]|uniref:O-antigen ligase C-terminal domain-containing protein n=1 Tax=Cupriavidus basilensis TaxID=68895 RepID=A0A643FLZ1_9BURK|nr:Wzy polymerase domain-containing protein [Cupriavidus basilensis]QOT77124.1 O-antigen ligase C-terminal domain-containing protein [Cupriavidus basilensis]